MSSKTNPDFKRVLGFRSVIFRIRCVPKYETIGFIVQGVSIVDCFHGIEEAAFNFTAQHFVSDTRRATAIACERSIFGEIWNAGGFEPVLIARDINERIAKPAKRSLLRQIIKVCLPLVGIEQLRRHLIASLTQELGSGDPNQLGKS